MKLSLGAQTKAKRKQMSSNVSSSFLYTAQQGGKTNVGLQKFILTEQN